MAKIGHSKTGKSLQFKFFNSNKQEDGESLVLLYSPTDNIIIEGEKYLILLNVNFFFFFIIKSVIGLTHKTLAHIQSPVVLWKYFLTLKKNFNEILIQMHETVCGHFLDGDWC